MSDSRKSLLLHAALLALLALIVFVFRSLVQEVYTKPLWYVGALALITLGVLGSFLRSVAASGSSNDKNRSWYIARGLGMSFIGAILSAILVGLYAYQLDPEFFERRLGWEEQLLIAEGTPESVMDFALENEKLNERLHAEEAVVGIIIGLTGLIGALALGSGLGGITKPSRTDSLIS